MSELSRGEIPIDSMEEEKKEPEHVQQNVEQQLGYTLDKGKNYRIYEMECVDCKQKFTRNIPNKWFNGNGNDRIVERNLPESLDLETVQAVFENPQCGACQPKNKKKLENLKNWNNQ